MLFQSFIYVHFIHYPRFVVFPQHWYYIIIVINIILFRFSWHEENLKFSPSVNNNSSGKKRSCSSIFTLSKVWSRYKESIVFSDREDFFCLLSAKKKFIKYSDAMRHYRWNLSFFKFFFLKRYLKQILLILISIINTHCFYIKKNL